MAITIKGTDNSASLPAYTGSDSDSGVFFPANNTVGFATGGTERARIDSSGNMGIGTSSPAASLSITKQSTTLSGTGNVYGLYVYPTSSGLAYIDAITSGAGSTALGFRTYNNGTYNDAVRIDSSGQVGIGTNSPTAKLDVYGASGPVYQFVRSGGSTGSDYAYYKASAGSTSVLNIAYGSGAAYTYSDTTSAYVIGTSGNAPLYFYTNNTTRILITAGGEFWWNNFATRPHMATGNVPAAAQFSTQYALEVNNRDALVGIFNRTNSTGAIVEFKYNASVIGSISTNGSSTSYNTSSDYRLKNSVAPMTTGLATVAALKPVTYKWNVDDSDGEGFIAHELQSVIPHAVTGEKDAVDADGKPIHQGVDYSKIVVHLVAAIQELKADLDTAKAEIAVLKGNA